MYALAPDLLNDEVLSGSGDGYVVAWPNFPEGIGRPVAHVGRPVYAICRIEDRIWVGDGDGALHVLDPTARRELLLERPHTHGIFSIRPLGDGRVACAGGDGVLTVMDLSGRSLRRIPLCQGKLRALAVHPSGETLAVACGDGTVRLLTLPDLNEVSTVRAHAPGCTALAWHPSKQALLSGGKDGRLRVWVPGREGALLDIPLHQGTLYGLAFSHDGRWCMTTGRDRGVRLLDAATLDVVGQQDRAHGRSVNAVVPRGTGFVTGGDDQHLVVWPGGDT